MTFDPKQIRNLESHFLNGMVLIVLPLLFAAMGFAEEIIEKDFFEDGFELELEESFNFYKETDWEVGITNEILDPTNLDGSIFDLIQSSITFGNFNSYLSNTNSSNNKLILNMLASPEISSIGFLDISANIEMDSKNRKFSNELTLFKLQNSSDSLNWKIGKFRKIWGDVDGASVLDVINPKGSIIGQSLPGMESSSRWLGEISFFSPSNTFEIFFSFNRDTVHALHSNTGESGSEIGFRSSFDIERGQLNLYLGALFPRTGVINVASGVSDSSRYNLLGMSAHKAVRNYLLKFDLAKKINLQRSSAFELVKDNRIDAAVGVEYVPSSNDLLSIALEGFLWEDRDGNYYIPGFSSALIEEGKSLTYNFSYSRNILNEKLSATISFGLNSNGSSSFVTGESTYSISDYTKIKANILFWEAEPNDPSYAYDNSKWINLGLTRYF